MLGDGVLDGLADEDAARVSETLLLSVGDGEALALPLVLRDAHADADVDGLAVALTERVAVDVAVAFALVLGLCVVVALTLRVALGRGEVEALALDEEEPSPMVISRTRLLPESVTYMRPVVSETTMPLGWRKRASVPMPSANEAAACPANVLTAPLAKMIRRMQLLLKSATKRLPAASGATLKGDLNRAAEPTESKKPIAVPAAAPPPATVATAPVIRL